MRSVAGAVALRAGFAAVVGFAASPPGPTASAAEPLVPAAAAPADPLAAFGWSRELAGAC